MSEMSGTDALHALDEAPVTRSHWRWTFLTAAGDYLDAGSIVAGAVALPLWAPHFALTAGVVGLVGGFSSNGISGAIGALTGGWLGDRLGRRTIYAWDLLLYVAGALVIIFASSAAMLIAGYVLIGLAVGADIPNSIVLLGEFAPRQKRSRLLGFGPVMWYIGPLVVTILAVALNGLGLTAVKIIFAHLAVIALIIWFLRRKMPESPRWAQLHGKTGEVTAAISELRTGNAVAASAPAKGGNGGGSSADGPSGAGAPGAGLSGGGFLRVALRKETLQPLAFLIVLFTIWNLPAGTYGFFFPYLVHTVGARNTFTADYLNMALYAIGIITLAVFMFIGDRVNRRAHFAVFSAVAAIGFFIFLFLPITSEGTVIANIVLMGVGGFSATYHLVRVWQAELFPTAIRGAGMGMSIFVARTVLGIWSIILPSITARLGFTPVALMLALMYVFIMIWGGLFGPETQGQPLENIKYTFRGALRGLTGAPAAQPQSRPVARS